MASHDLDQAFISMFDGALRLGREERAEANPGHPHQARRLEACSFARNAHEFRFRVYQYESNWKSQFEIAKVHVQWDPEITSHGKKLEHRSIQVGLSRHIIREFTDDWILEISSTSLRARKIWSLYYAGNLRRAKELLPKERIYSVTGQAAQRLGLVGRTPGEKGTARYRHAEVHNANKPTLAWQIHVISNRMWSADVGRITDVLKMHSCSPCILRICDFSDALRTRCFLVFADCRNQLGIAVGASILLFN